MSWDGFQFVPEEEGDAPEVGQAPAGQDASGWKDLDLNPDGPPVDENEFQDWYLRWADTIGLDPNPDHPDHKYDYRAAYKAGVEPQIGEDGFYHWDSKFKSDDHPNRFIGGVDTKTGKRQDDQSAPATADGWKDLPLEQPVEEPAAAAPAKQESGWKDIPLEQAAAGTQAQPAVKSPDQLEQPAGAEGQLLTEGDLKGGGWQKPTPIARDPEFERREAEKLASKQKANEEAIPYQKIIAGGVLPDTILEMDAVRDLISGMAMDRAGMLWEKRRQLAFEGKDLSPEEIKYLNILDKAMGYDSLESGLMYALASGGEIIGQQINGLMDDQMNAYITGGYAAMAAGVTAAFLSGPLALISVPAAMAAAGGAAMAVQVFRRSKAVEGGLAFKELMEEDPDGKWDAKTKAIAADIIGSINGALELAGFEAAIKLIPGLRELTRGGVRPFVKRNKVLREAILNAAKNWSVGVAGETGTELLQEPGGIIAKAMMNDQSVLDALTSEEALDQYKEVVQKVGSGMALLGAVGVGHGVVKAAKEQNDVNREANKRLMTVLPMYEKYADAMEGGLETGTVTVDFVQQELEKARAQWPENPIIPRMEKMVEEAGGTVERPEQVGPSLYTPSTDEDLEALKAHIQDRTGTTEEIEVTPAVERKGMGVVQQIAAATGAKVVFFRGSGYANEFNGVFDPESGTIFINENSADPFATVLGHETTHQLRTQAPDLYEKLSEVMRGGEIGLEEHLVTLNEARKAGGLKELTLDEALAREEFIADFVGQQFANADFWAKVNKQNPSLGQKLATLVFDMIEKIKKVFSLDPNAYDREYVQKLDQVQDALAGVYTEFSKRKTAVDLTVQPAVKSTAQKAVEAVGSVLSPAAAEAKTVTVGPKSVSQKSSATSQAAGESAPAAGAEAGWKDMELPPEPKAPETAPEAEKAPEKAPEAEKEPEKAAQAKPEAPAEAQPEPEAKGKGEEKAPPLAPELEAQAYAKEITKYRRENKGKVYIPDELTDAWEFIKDQVAAGSVERGETDGYSHVVGSTYPVWFGKKGGKWSRKEFEAIAKKVDNGEKLTQNQLIRFYELIDVMVDVRANDPEMAARSDQQAAISELEEKGFTPVMAEMMAAEIPDGAQVRVEGEVYTVDGFTDDGFIRLKGKEELALEPFDVVFIEGMKGGKKEKGDEAIMASLKRQDFDVKVTAVDEEGNVARVKEKASVALAENKKQLEFARRLLQCLDS
jgi:hypothetical protein